jgi:hypothetical protein
LISEPKCDLVGDRAHEHLCVELQEHHEFQQRPRPLEARRVGPFKRHARFAHCHAEPQASRIVARVVENFAHTSQSAGGTAPPPLLLPP